MSQVWLDADVPALIRLARLTDQVNRGEYAGVVLAEIRQLEDRFGLSPLARRRLAWELEQATGAKDGDADSSDTAAAKAEEEGRWLRAVSD